jgi:hypothetical protein
MQLRCTCAIRCISRSRVYHKAISQSECGTNNGICCTRCFADGGRVRAVKECIQSSLVGEEWRQACPSHPVVCDMLKESCPALASSTSAAATVGSALQANAPAYIPISQRKLAIADNNEVDDKGNRAITTAERSGLFDLAAGIEPGLPSATHTGKASSSSHYGNAYALL